MTRIFINLTTLWRVYTITLRWTMTLLEKKRINTKPIQLLNICNLACNAVTTMTRSCRRLWKFRGQLYCYFKFKSSPLFLLIFRQYNCFVIFPVYFSWILSSIIVYKIKISFCVYEDHISKHVPLNVIRLVCKIVY